MKTRRALTISSKDTLIARYLKETSVDSSGDYDEMHRIDLKELGRSMLASMEKLSELGGFNRGNYKE
jgi:hypothetical protein